MAWPKLTDATILWVQVGAGMGLHSMARGTKGGWTGREGHTDGKLLQGKPSKTGANTFNMATASQTWCFSSLPLADNKMAH